MSGEFRYKVGDGCGRVNCYDDLALVRREFVSYKYSGLRPYVQIWSKEKGCYEGAPRLSEELDAIPPVRVPGAQPGNRNRAKGKYGRVVLSLSGPDYDRLVDAISQNGPATNADIEDAVYAAIRQVYSEQ